MTSDTKTAPAALLERAACIADVESEPEFPGEPTAEQIALIREHPMLAMREAVAVTKACIVARIRARGALTNV